MKTQLPEDFLLAVGKVAVKWPELELVVDLALRKLLDFDLNDPNFLMLTAHMSWPQREQLMESLVNRYLPDYPHLADYKVIKSALRVAQLGRNKFVHANWDVQGTTVFRMSVSARGKLVTTREPVTVAEIEEVADQIGRVAVDLYKLVFAAGR